jgi:isopentenyl-diphosphate delta-isomerase
LLARLSGTANARSFQNFTLAE